MEVCESCQFSSLCLWTSCRVAIVLSCLNILLIFITWGLSYVSKLFIDGMCVVALAHAKYHECGCITIYGGNVVDEQLVYCNLSTKGLCNIFVITLCK